MRQEDEVVAVPTVNTSAELLARIVPARAALDAVVAALRDDELMRAGRGGGWPPIGHLTHISVWERMIVAHLDDGSDHRVVGMTPEEYAQASLDALNARIYSLHARDTALDVRAAYAAAHGEIVAFVARLTPADLARRYWEDEARTVAEKIAGDTYLHYAEHRGWILEIVERKA